MTKRVAKADVGEWMQRSFLLKHLFHCVPSYLQFVLL